MSDTGTLSINCIFMYCIYLNLADIFCDYPRDVCQVFSFNWNKLKYRTKKDYRTWFTDRQKIIFPARARPPSCSRIHRSPALCPSQRSMISATADGLFPNTMLGVAAAAQLHSRCRLLHYYNAVCRRSTAAFPLWAGSLYYNALNAVSLCASVGVQLDADLSYWVYI